MILMSVLEWKQVESAKLELIANLRKYLSEMSVTYVGFIIIGFIFVGVAFAIFKSKVNFPRHHILLVRNFHQLDTVETDTLDPCNVSFACYVYFRLGKLTFGAPPGR